MVVWTLKKSKWRKILREHVFPVIVSLELFIGVGDLTLSKNQYKCFGMVYSVPVLSKPFCLLHKRREGLFICIKECKNGKNQLGCNSGAVQI